MNKSGSSFLLTHDGYSGVLLDASVSIEDVLLNAKTVSVSINYNGTINFVTLSERSPTIFLVPNSIITGDPKEETLKLEAMEKSLQAALLETRKQLGKDA